MIPFGRVAREVISGFTIVGLVAPGGYVGAQRSSPEAAHAVLLRHVTAGGVPLTVVDADLTSPSVHVTVQLARGGIGTAEATSSMLARSKPVAAINGAYFSKTDLHPIGDIVIDGQVALRGWFKTALTIDRLGRAGIVRHNVGSRVDWSPYETVLACSPALVLDGRVDYEADARNHRDPHATGKVSRMGVGVTDAQHLLLVSPGKPMTFGEWAAVMQRLGCRYAMNLDSGASRMLYYRGRYLVQPGRDLTNLLLVYDGERPPLAEALAPLERGAQRIISPPMQLRVDDVAPDDPSGVTVKLCGETGRRATLWCPATVQRRLKRAHIPGPCRLHKPPPGEH
jgi:hypothetical protein